MQHVISLPKRNLKCEPLLQFHVDGDPVCFSTSGVGNAARGLLDAISSCDSSVGITCCVSKDAPETEWLAAFRTRPNITVKRLLLSKRQRNMLEVLGFPVVDVPERRAGSVALYLYPRVPGANRAPQLCIVHDLSSVRMPEQSSMPWHGIVINKKALKEGKRRNVQFIACSRFTQVDLAGYLDIRQEDITQIYWGVDRQWSDLSSDLLCGAVCRKYSILGTYFIWYGQITPRKNIPNLLRAYASAYRLYGEGFPDLVLVGARGESDCGTLTPTELGIAHKVRTLPSMELPDLVALVSGAVALVFPSWYEGFGLPVIEALTLGTPVLLSNRAALPEIAGPACLLFDPADVEDIARQLGRAASEVERLRTSANLEGRAWAARFSFGAAARTILSLARKALDQDGSNV